MRECPRPGVVVVLLPMLVRGCPHLVVVVARLPLLLVPGEVEWEEWRWPLLPEVVWSREQQWQLPVVWAVSGGWCHLSG